MCHAVFSERPWFFANFGIPSFSRRPCPWTNIAEGLGLCEVVPRHVLGRLADETTSGHCDWRPDCTGSMICWICWRRFHLQHFVPWCSSKSPFISYFPTYFAHLLMMMMMPGLWLWLWLWYFIMTAINPSKKTGLWRSMSQGPLQPPEGAPPQP